MDNYPGVTALGDRLLVPYVRLATFPDGLSEAQVEIDMLEQQFSLSGLLAYCKVRLDTQRESDRAASKPVPFNGFKARVANYSVDDGDQPKLRLIVQATKFYDYLASNKVLDTPLGELGGMTPREFYDLEPLGMDDVLANCAGVNGAFLTTDDYMVIVHRSPKLEQYPDLLGVPAAFWDPLKDDGSPKDCNPFYTLRRDAAIEETGRKVVEAKLFELGRALDDLHFEIGMIGSIDGSKAQVQSAPKVGEWEAKGRYFVPFNPRDCAPHLVKTITQTPPKVPERFWINGRSPQWVPAHHRIVYLALANKYGQDEVEREMEKAMSA